MSDSRPVNESDVLAERIRKRVESRYRRIVFVHSELAKVADAAKKETPFTDGKGRTYRRSFEDMVFSTIDFSRYQKIQADEFTLLFDEGLYDFAQSFFQKTFGTNREMIRRTISRAYLKAGPLYICLRTNPLILSIMRSVHTSLEFAPLLVPADLPDGQYDAVAAGLDGVVIRHEDGMETRLFAAGNGTGLEPAALYGTFHPLGKAYTVVLIPSTE